MKVIRVGLTAIVLSGLTAGGVSEATAQQTSAGEGMLGRVECVRLVRLKRAQEAGGMRDMLAREPDQLAQERGPAFLQKVREYIGLREAVLFRCPPNVLNATAAPLDERLKAEPPLPGKGPKLTRPAVQRRTVPLPVPRPI